MRITNLESGNTYATQTDQTGTYRGRPVDVAVGKDGSLFVSDDYAGAIYRITYSAP